jgi:hypothetical protein
MKNVLTRRFNERFVKNLNNAVVLFASLLFGTSAFCSGLIEYQDTTDEFKTVKRIPLKSGENYKLNIAHLGWDFCNFKNSSDVSVKLIETSCFTKNGGGISLFCYDNKNETVTLHNHKGLPVMILKLICKNDR